MNPVLPMVHLNGTSLVTLLETYNDARLAVSAAIDALAAVEFHSRDYYPKGNGAWAAAVTERGEELAKLTHVLHYLNAHVDHLANQ